MNITIKNVIGGVLITLGACVIGYVGIWVMFIGGIIDIVTFAKEGYEEMILLGIGIVKILLASPVGYLCGLVLLGPGLYMLDN